VNVLLVEDEPRVADFIDRGLRAENHGVTVAGTGGEGVDLAKTGEFDVIVLDLMLPDMHGYDVCQRLRQEGDRTPILMLTAMDTLEDKIKGLKIGADDYLAKPFDFDELLVRLEALVRRSHNFAPTSNILQIADLVLDRDLLEVRRGGATRHP
jgi:DNA-binding response OmpR family regulator